MIKIVNEIETVEDLRYYLKDNSWSGAVDMVNAMDEVFKVTEGKIDLFEVLFDTLYYQDAPTFTVTEVNDYLWFYFEKELDEFIKDNRLREILYLEPIEFDKKLY